jgi:hypothetical protein
MAVWFHMSDATFVVWLSDASFVGRYGLIAMRFLFLALRGHAGQPGPRAENRQWGLKGPSVKSLTESHFVS